MTAFCMPNIAHLEHGGVCSLGVIPSLRETSIAWRESMHTCRSRCITNASMSPCSYICSHALTQSLGVGPWNILASDPRVFTPRSSIRSIYSSILFNICKVIGDYPAFITLHLHVISLPAA